MIHNEDATLSNLARNVLTTLSGEHSLVQTETIRLLLNKLIERLEPKQMATVEESQDRTVRNFIARITTAERDRDEGQRDGETAPRKSWS